MLRDDLPIRRKRSSSHNSRWSNLAGFLTFTLQSKTGGRNLKSPTTFVAGTRCFDQGTTVSDDGCPQLIPHRLEPDPISGMQEQPQRCLSDADVIAGRCFLARYSGHGIIARKRVPVGRERHVAGGFEVGNALVDPIRGHVHLEILRTNLNRDAGPAFADGQNVFINHAKSCLFIGAHSVYAQYGKHTIIIRVMHCIGIRSDSEMSEMSKFSKPKPAAVTKADIDRVIEGADAVDDRRVEKKPTAEPEPREVRFTMTLAGDLVARVDRAKKVAGGMTRLSWIRLAITERLARDGV